jgi:hypothetical protein
MQSNINIIRSANERSISTPASAPAIKTNRNISKEKKTDYLIV